MVLNSLTHSPKERRQDEKPMGGDGTGWRVLRIYSLASKLKHGAIVQHERVVCGKDSWHWWDGGLGEEEKIVNRRSAKWGFA